MIVFPQKPERFLSLQENPKLYIVLSNHTRVFIGALNSLFGVISETTFGFGVDGSLDVIDVHVVLKGNKNLKPEGK